MQHTVEVYSAPWCPWCTKVKEFLTKKGVKYIEKDVDVNPAYGEEVQKVSRQTGIPVTVIDGKVVIIGYNEKGIKEALGMK